MITYDEPRYISQFVPEMFDSFQYDSTRDAPQYELICNIFVTVTIAMHFVSDLLIKSFSGHL